MNATTKRPNVETFPRPYILTFHATGTSYPISSEDAANLIAEYPIVSASSNRVVLRGDDGRKTTIQAATLGGGPAFKVTR